MSINVGNDETENPLSNVKVVVTSSGTLDVSLRTGRLFSIQTSKDKSLWRKKSKEPKTHDTEISDDSVNATTLLTSWLPDYVVQTIQTSDTQLQNAITSISSEVLAVDLNAETGMTIETEA